MIFKKSKLPSIPVMLLLLVLVFLTVYPLGMIIYGSFRSAAPGAPAAFFTLDGYREAFADPTIIKSIINTLGIAIVRTIITMCLAVFLCWVVIRTDTPMRNTLEFLFWLNFFLPMLPMTMGWILLLDPDYGFINELIKKIPFMGDLRLDCYSYFGIIWVHIGYSTSVRVLMFGPAFRNMDAALEESSRMSGASNIGTLIRVTFPLLLPAIMGATLLGFIRSLESFEVELLLGMPAKIYVYATKVYDLLHWEPPQYPPAMALSTIFMLIIALLIIGNRWVMSRRQYTTVTGRGFQVRPILLGKWRYATLAFCLTFVAVWTFLPLVFLVMGTFMKIAGLFDVPDPFTLVHWRVVMADPLLLPSLKNSLIMCVAAAFGGMFFYSIISYISVRTNLRGKEGLEIMSWLPWAVPGLLLAVGLLWVFVGGVVSLAFMYGTIYILILGQIVKELPMGVRIMNGTMIQVGKELEESSRVHGGTWFYTFRRILVPLLSPTFVATAVMIFLAAMRDIQLVVLLYTGKSRVLSILMLEHYLGFSAEKGMAVGLLLTVIVVGVAIFARRFGLKLGVRGS